MGAECRLCRVQSPSDLKRLRTSEIDVRSTPMFSVRSTLYGAGVDDVSSRLTVRGGSAPGHGRLVNEIQRQRYGDDFPRIRGKKAIATARANGKFPPAHVVVCEVCSAYPQICGEACAEREHRFEVPPSRSRLKRCPSCVGMGHAICGGCGALVSVSNRGGKAICGECKELGRRGTARERSARITVMCRGPESTPFKAPSARRCRESLVYTAARLERLTRYDAASGTVVCNACLGVEKAIQLWLPRMKATGLKPRSYEQYRAMLKPFAKRYLTQERPDWVKERWGEATELVEARKEGKGGRRGARASEASLAAPWARPTPVGGFPTSWEIDICHGCGKLLIRATAPTAAKPDFHRACFDSFRREARERREQLRMLGFSGVDLSRNELRPPFATSRRDPKILTRNFGWAMQHLVLGVAQHELAEKAFVTPQVVSEALASIIDLLPGSTVMSARFRPHVELLAKRANRPAGRRAIAA